MCIYYVDIRLLINIYKLINKYMLSYVDIRTYIVTYAEDTETIDARMMILQQLVSYVKLNELARVETWKVSFANISLLISAR